jgi:hypothetical protein
MGEHKQQNTLGRRCRIFAGSARVGPFVFVSGTTATDEDEAIVGVGDL